MKALGIDLHSGNPIKFQFDNVDIDDGIRRDITVVSHMRESHEMILANMIRIYRHLPAGHYSNSIFALPPSLIVFGNCRNKSNSYRRRSTSCQT